MITHIEYSPLQNKRYRVTMDDGRQFDFGYKISDFASRGRYKFGSTYLDHRNEKKRSAYWARHYSNPTEKQLIDNLVPSPSLFSAYILWGPSTDLEYNIRFLNKLWAKKQDM